MKILGISAFYHDSAAALVRDGVVVAAAQEERFTRKKHDSGYPENAIDYCLKSAGLKLGEIDHFVYYEKPFVKFERLLETYFAFAPRGFQSFRLSMPAWFGEKLFQKSALIRKLKKSARDVDWSQKLLFSEHHLSHAASAFFPSPFDKAAILTMDGVGEWTTTSLMMGEENQIRPLREIHFPHSIGMLYSAFTYYLGFKVNSGEYKVMGLAPYGEPKFADKIREDLIDIKPDGSFRLNMDYFEYCTGLTMTGRRFADLFGVPERKPEQKLTQVHMDLAASVQKVTEDVVIRLARAIAQETGAKNLCLAGGVALNCVANGKIWREKLFDGIWIQPAAGDAGGALGAALAGYHMQLGRERKTGVYDSMKGSYLGPQFETHDIVRRLESMGARVQVFSDEQAIEQAATDLADGKAMGWFSGRMEFGPRALGARSIIADPRRKDMQSTLNLKIKYRESFRPFAPSVLAEDVSDWFEYDERSPYMLMVAPVKEEHRKVMTEEQQKLFGIDKLNVPRSTIPAITHVDYSARIQTVHQDSNPRFHRLLSLFKEKTGCPVLVNTSFNVRGEPIVCTPADGFEGLLQTECLAGKQRL